MSRKREAFFMGIGVLAGIALCGPAAQAAANLTASPTSQIFYVNGQKMEFEAYEIHGNNFVKLRDIAKAVDFGVTYDAAANSVYIDPNAHYQEEVTPSAQTTPAPSTAGEYAISADHWSREDFSRQANPAVFTGIYDRALYNTIRQTIVDGGAVGDSPAYTMVGPWEDYSAVKKLLGRLEGVLRYEHYVPKNFPLYYEHLDYFAVSAAMPEIYQEPYNFIQPVIRATAGMTDREKVECLNDYLGILEGYRQNGLPVTALKKAWEHAVREVHQETKRINAMAFRSIRRRNGHER